jgi:hypothetical protein
LDSGLSLSLEKTQGNTYSGRRFLCQQSLFICETGAIGSK